MITNYAEERCYKVNVTPELAQDWLARNKCNRAISDAYVASLIRDMKEGKWIVNGDTIRFSKEGELLDGQHRLTAIVKSGIPQDVYVMTGLNKTSHFDDGRKRSIRDQILAMGMAGKDDPFANSHCIATARYIHSLNKYGNGRCHGIKPSTEDIFYWMVKHEVAMCLIYKMSRSHNGAVNARSAFLLAAVVAAFEAGIPEERILSWYKSIRTGEYSGEKQLSAIVLRNLIISTNRAGERYAPQKEMFLKSEYSLSTYDIKPVKILQAKECFPLPMWDVQEGE